LLEFAYEPKVFNLSGLVADIIDTALTWGYRLWLELQEGFSPPGTHPSSQHYFRPVRIAYLSVSTHNDHIESEIVRAPLALWQKCDLPYS
jgi:hypothetical protein